MLDSNKLIYYDEYTDNLTPVFSELFTVKDIRPYFYYVMQFKENENSNMGFIGLWKCKNGDRNIDSAQLIKKLKKCIFEESQDFDYEAFWVNNYKRLMGKIKQ